MFEISDHLRDRRLCDPHLGGGLGHAAELHNLREDVQVAQPQPPPDMAFPIQFQALASAFIPSTRLIIPLIASAALLDNRSRLQSVSISSTKEDQMMSSCSPFRYRAAPPTRAAPFALAFFALLGMAQARQRNPIHRAQSHGGAICGRRPNRCARAHHRGANAGRLSANRSSSRMSAAARRQHRTAKVVREKPDGYTASSATGERTSSTAPCRRCSYDLLKDFEPVALIANNPHVIVSRKDCAGQGSEGTHHLDQGESGQADGREQRDGQPVAHQRPLFPEPRPGRDFPSYRIAVRAQPCRTWSGDRSISISIRCPTRFPTSAAAESRLMRWPPHRASRRRRRFRPSMRRGCRASTSRCGTAIWVPKGTPKGRHRKTQRAIVHALRDEKFASG